MLSLTTVTPLVQRIAERLTQLGWIISCAESCTGGLLAASFTSLAGSSVWFEQSWVTYSNRSKMQRLGVESVDITTFGAVSEQVATGMAEGSAQMAKAQVGVGITGIAGPGGGTPHKPVGTVCIAVYVVETEQLYVETCHFLGDRAAIRAQSVERALQLILLSLEGHGVYA